MSTYEYFEFAAVERSLTEAETIELRHASSRATITSNGFVNEYHYGNFKGDARDWLGRFFDAYVRSASWGSCELTLALPGEAWSDDALAPFLEGGVETGWVAAFEAERRGGRLLLTWSFAEDDVDDERFWGEGDGPGWIARLLPLREELLRGDPRALYLGWLARWSRGGIKADGPDEPREPPLPAGLGELTSAQDALVEFAVIDPDLLGAAAAASASSSRVDGDGALDRWLDERPPEELRGTARLLLAGRGAEAERSLRRAWLASCERPDDGTAATRRSVATIEAEIDVVRSERLERERHERERVEAERAAERARHLERVAREAEARWTAIDKDLERGVASGYDAALARLQELRDALEAASRTDEYRARFDDLVERHGRRPAWRRRLRDAGLLEKGETRERP